MVAFGLIDDGLQGFLRLWALIYTVLLMLYFGVGAVLVALNARHPERRIQNRVRSQRVRADIIQSLVALLTIAAYVAGGLSLQHAGWALFAPAPLSFFSFVGWAMVSFVVYDAWFYWGHRAMHTPALFRFHALHHRSITPTTWSNNSDSMAGALVEQGYFLIAPLLLPIPPEVLIAHKLFDQVTGMISHCGHEYVAGPSARAPWPLLCTSFHDQHHSNFRCNFGNTFSLWDRLMGTIHPGYDALVRRIEHPAADGRGVDGKPLGD